MRYLITGGAGFIGSNFVKFILNKYKAAEVINLDKLTYAGNIDNIASLKADKRHRFVKGDIRDRRLVTGLAGKADVIVNFAAETHVDRSINDSSCFIDTNIAGVRNLLEACKGSGAGLFVQISTDEVYGSIKRGRFREDSPLAPGNPYSASKAGADLLCMSYANTYGLPVIITRSGNNFGPYQYPEKVIPLFITNLLRNKKVPLYSRGENIRDWIYVYDNCAAIDTVIRKGRKEGVYNIASNSEITNLNLTKLILKKMNKGHNMIRRVKDRLGHDFRYSLDTHKIRTLGWRPEYNFNDALNLTIGWYSGNFDWWKKRII
ncbi:MAG: dTDP-glucose 4,6-dehydratase [Candidatus Omnitrophica bacterium]|nr:dTDP-glucose 4,6-dehydratase [Candidatus Omnitrophota bacterium]